MTPQSQPRKPRNSSRVNWLISLSIHGLIVLVAFYFAARSGLIGRQLQKMTVSMVKEPPPEKPKGPEKPKEEAPKEEPPKLAVMPVVTAPKEALHPSSASPQAATAPVAAPPPAEIAGFDFDGGKAVVADSDPVSSYKGLVENSLRARWNRPTDMDDLLFVAEIDITVNGEGELSDPVWKKSSGNKKWDDSVKAALAATTSLPLAPPKNFPPRVTVRFDVTEGSQLVMP
jgi:outer membrane biosynthesis protein TonB